jgi:hypothetical protein
MVAVPVVCWLFPGHRHTAGRYIVWLVVWYGLSKVLEHFDTEVFDLLGHTISGHTLKHLAAAVATYVVLRMLLAPRQPGVQGGVAGDPGPGARPETARS